MLQQFEFAKVAALEALRPVSHVDAEPGYVGADEATYDTLIERFVQAVSHLDLSGIHQPEVKKAVRFTGRQYSRSAKKELNRKAKTQHKAWMSILTLSQTASGMSWHTPGLATCMISDIESIKVPRAVQVLYEDWTSPYENDPHFQPHWDELRVNKYVEIQGKSYNLHHGKVRTEGRICVPFACVKQVIKACHEYAHPGVEKTPQIFYGSYVCFSYKPDDIRTMVASVVNPCPICRQGKGWKELQPESNQPAPVPKYPFSSVCIDFCDLSSRPCTSNNRTYDYVVVCPLTGYVVAVPCSKTLDAQGLADMYLERVVPIMGLPQEMFSDQDHLVTAEFFKELCSLSGIAMKQSTIKRPQSNGRAERAVRVVVESLRQWLLKMTSKNWAQLLRLAIWASNDIPGPISGYSPHYLVFGRNAVGFGDCPPVVPQSESTDAVGFFKKLVADRKMVQNELNRLHRPKAEQFLKAHPSHV